MLTELLEKYGKQKPMDLGTAVERTIPVSAVIRMMEEYHESKIKEFIVENVLLADFAYEIGKFKCLLNEKTGDLKITVITTSDVIKIQPKSDNCVIIQARNHKS